MTNEETTVEPGKCVYDHPYPCGHGECEKTGAWSPEGIAAAILAAPLGAGDRRASGAPDSARFEGTRWSPADLDRCEHGRHSIDHCYDCPNGRSTGNLFLVLPGRYPGCTMRTRDGRTEVRIGTMVRGEPIWVVVRDTPRESK